MTNPSDWHTSGTIPGSGPADPYDFAPGSIPWEVSESPATMIETIKKVLLDPVTTFSGADRDCGLGASFKYSFILLMIGGALALLWQRMTGIGTIEDLPPQLEHLAPLLSRPGLFALLLLPVQALVMLFLGSGVTHMCLALVGGANNGFDATFRAVAYANGSTAPLQVVPILGSVVAGLWALVAQVVALKELHDTTYAKAILSLVIPFFLVCGFATIALVVIFGAAGLQGLSNL